MPSPAGRMAQRAGRFAPAVAVLGVLAGMPHSFAPAPHTSAAMRPAALAVGYPGQVRSGLTEGPMPAGRARARPRPALTGIARYRPARLLRPARHRHHHLAAQPHVLACTGTGGMLPANSAAIVSFLTAHGYTGIAAAGIAGNIYQESGGNPESIGSGGGGLIGWTPLPAGLVTGNPAADLQAQLNAILSFNQIWAQYIPALNGAATPAQAADIYVTDFERAGIPAAGNREAAAAAVAAACGL